MTGGLYHELSGELGLEESSEAPAIPPQS